MGKTQKSLSDSARLRGRPKGFRVRVNASPASPESRQTR
jgi:formyltetrahydrofolate synthetase